MAVCARVYVYADCYRENILEKKKTQVCFVIVKYCSIVSFVRPGLRC